MEIKIETTVLASPDLALGRVGPFGLVLNGTQLVDEADFFRAASPTFFVRGNVGATLQFSVTRIFGSIRKAEAFLLEHWGAVPRSGLVTVTAGETGDTQTLYLRNAVLESLALPGNRGLSAVVQYTIRGGLWEGDVPPEDIPGAPEGGEAFVVLRRGKVAIANGATSVAVVFSSPLAAVPAVAPTVSRPTGGDAIWPILRKDTVTINGFTCDLSGAVPDGTYELHYIAVE